MRKRLSNAPDIESKTIDCEVFASENTYVLFNAEKIIIKPYAYMPATTGFYASMTNNEGGVIDFIEKEKKFEYDFDLTFFKGSFMLLNAPDKSFKYVHEHIKKELDHHLTYLFGNKGVEEFVLFWELPHIDKNAYLCVIASANDLEPEWDKLVRAMPGVKISSYLPISGATMALPDSHAGELPLFPLEDCPNFDKNNADHLAIYEAFKSVSTHQQNLEKTIKAEKILLTKELKALKLNSQNKVANKKTIIKL